MSLLNYQLLSSLPKTVRLWLVVMKGVAERFLASMPIVSGKWYDCGVGLGLRSPGMWKRFFALPKVAPTSSLSVLFKEQPIFYIAEFWFILILSNTSGAIISDTASVLLLGS